MQQQSNAQTNSDTQHHSSEHGVVANLPRVIPHSQQFETLVADLATVFARLPASDIDQEIRNGLRYLVECLGVDRSALLEFSADQTALYAIYSYAAPEMRPFIYTEDLKQKFPWTAGKLLRGEVVCVPRLDELPAALSDKLSSRQAGIKSYLTIPVSVSGTSVCAITLGAVRAEIDWPPEWMPRLRLVGEICANALVRKRAEEASRRLEHELARAVHSAILGECTASVAHELNQPLAAILNNAQAAYRILAMEPPNLAEVREALLDIVDDDRRAGKIIQQLQRLGKQGPLERTPLDLNTLVQEVVYHVRRNALDREVTIQLELGTGLPLVYGNRLQVQQVILNLMLNAFEAMRQSTSHHPGMLVIRTTQEDARITVALHDTGIGVDETTLERMFNAFFTTKTDGMGMGLSISRAIVEAHGGQIWAMPNADHGTTVYFTLPTSEEEAL